MSDAPPSADPIALDYQHPRDVELEPAGPRPWWVYAIVLAYLMLLAALLIAPMYFRMTRDDSSLILTGSVYVCVLLLCGFALLLPRVRARRGRPITRRSIWIPIVGSATLFVAIAAATLFVLAEYFRWSFDETGSGLVVWGAIGMVWLLWMALFGWLSRHVDPTTLAGRMHRTLLVGNALELLIAVPAHIVVRRRTDCCAGVMTGIGICVGVTVMLVAFGPSVYILYRKRWKRLTKR